MSHIRLSFFKLASRRIHSIFNVIPSAVSLSLQGKDCFPEKFFHEGKQGLKNDRSPAQALPFLPTPHCFQGLFLTPRIYPFFRQEVRVHIGLPQETSPWFLLGPAPTHVGGKQDPHHEPPSPSQLPVLPHPGFSAACSHFWKQRECWDEAWMS